MTPPLVIIDAGNFVTESSRLYDKRYSKVSLDLNRKNANTG